tara:strand:- start:82 stop:267 length:186 start_codon:yes stop_codon:yes gene_type:complete
MDFKYKTYKIEQYKDESWVNAERSSDYPKEFTGLTEDQTDNVILSFVQAGISSDHLRVVQE